MTSGAHSPRARDFSARCYSWSRTIHWITVLLLSGVLVTATVTTIDPKGAGNGAYRWHSSLGLAVYVLAISRVLLWMVYRPTSRVMARRPSSTDTGLRMLFYALLIALPVSGWVIASEEGKSAHTWAIPMLPQWYNPEHAAAPVANDQPSVQATSSREVAMVAKLARVHAGLAVALCLTIVLHLVSELGRGGVRQRFT